ncbi:MAG: cysteine--tRNA ligase [Candidatus Saccharibacteria bacterium]|nr:cysteine--tRNA ligase [Candidatus Saccharibacteria bacterium]
MKLYDTRTKSYRQYVPQATVGMYVCGITPYAAAHLGHAFTFLTYDLLQRRLEDMGSAVHMVRNITDVDEPLYAKADELELHYTDLAENEIALFHKAMCALNMRVDTSQPRASEFIAEMAEAVQRLLDSGVGYRLDKDVYFDTTKVDEYGSFFGYKLDLAIAIDRLRGGNPDLKAKRNKQDFLLWKSVDDSDDPAQWDSPVGRGRPGWHIECSVMSRHLLGDTFDIHGGGTDLVYPHHEAEIAQSKALHGHNPADFWVHTSPILLAGEKMSKSLGNLIFVSDLLREHPMPVVRLALMHYHHRIGGEWAEQLLHEATELWKKLSAASGRRSVAAVETLLRETRAALDDDINTLEVIDALHRFADAPAVVATDSSAQLDKVWRLLGLKAI